MRTRSEDIAQDDSAGIAGGTTNHGTVVQMKRKKRTAQEILEMFPAVNSGHTPTGVRVLVQKRVVAKKTKGGIIITDADRDADRGGVAYGKVVGMGSSCFKNGKDEIDADFKIGDYVRIPKWGGDVMTVNDVDFAFVNWWDVMAVVDLSVIP
jgi:co-chaperonin GroES (HSP10)